jgi:hypothetical protein
MAAKTYRLYVIDSSITGNLGRAVMKAVERSAPVGSLYLVAMNFQNFVQTLNQLSTPAEIQRRGKIADLTVIAHGGVAGSFRLGPNLVGHDEFNSVATPFLALAPGARIDVIRCASALPSTGEDRRSLYKTIGRSLLPAGGRVGGTADDVEFSDGGGARLMRGAAPVGGHYPTRFHSLELLKQVPQEAEGLTTHTVRFGDRFWHLNRDYGYRDPQDFTNEVMTLNPGIDFTRLRPGQQVTVPTRAGPAPRLGPPWALSQRQALRRATPPPAASQMGALAQIRNALERTPWAERIVEPPQFFGPRTDAIGALERMERAAREQERRRQWLSQIRNQLDRRPTTLSAGGQPANLLRSLGQRLEASGSIAAPPMNDMSAIGALGRLEQQAEQRERTERWLEGIRQQLDRRPARSAPSTLAQLGRLLQPGRQPWQPPWRPPG